MQVCYEYAKNNGYTVIGEYIDCAQSGTTDNRAEFQRMIADSSKQFILSKQDFTDFPYELKNGSLNNIHRRRSLINIFIGAIYLFDDRFRIILNGSEKPIEIDDELLDEVNDYFDGLNKAKAECSHLVANDFICFYFTAVSI